MKKDSIHATLHFYLAALVMLTYPFSLKVSSVMVGVWAAHWIAMIFAKQVVRPKMAWLLLMISYPLLFVFSLSYSENLPGGVHAIERRISLFIVPLMVSTVEVWDNEHRDRLLWISYLSALIAALVCIILASYDFLTMGVRHFYWTDLTRPLGFHPGYFSFFISITVLWFLHHLQDHWNSRSSAFRIFSILSVAFLTGFMILLASKLHLFLFYTTLIALGIYRARQFDLKVKLALLIFLVASLYFISTTFIKDRVGSISTISYNLNDPPQKFNDLTIRLALAECSWDVIKSNWLLGVGTGDSYDELEKVYRRVDYQYGYLDHQEPHNEYLYTLVATGMVGLALLLGTFGLSIYLAWSRKDLIHLLFIVFFAVSCLFESMLSQQKGIVLFSILNSIFVFQWAGRDADLA